MKYGTYLERALLRQASDLMRKLLSGPEARGLLELDVAYLRLLGQRAVTEELLLVSTVRAARLKSLRLPSGLPVTRADLPVAHYIAQRPDSLAASLVYPRLRLLGRLGSRATHGFRR